MAQVVTGTDEQIRTLVVLVDGDPRPQGNHRVSRSGVIYEQSSMNLKTWRASITLIARAAARRAQWREPLVGPVSVRIRFAMRPLKTVVRSLPTVAPDIDKLVRPVLDALTDAKIWGDDSQVTSLVAHKVYAAKTPGVRIEIAGAA